MTDSARQDDHGCVLQSIDREALEARFELAQLHATLLPHSPVALLGPRFMHAFYYSVLVADGLIFGVLARIGGRPAGFMMATADASGFMTAGVRHHPVRLAAVLAASLLAQPVRWRAAWEALQIMRHLPSPPADGSTGELLSFGILPEYRSPAFVAKTGIRLGPALLGSVLAELEARGVRSVRSLVDDDNTAAKLFYHAAGWSLGQQRVEGWKQPVVEFVLELPRVERPAVVPAASGQGSR